MTQKNIFDRVENACDTVTEEVTNILRCLHSYNVWTHVMYPEVEGDAPRYNSLPTAELVTQNPKTGKQIRLDVPLGDLPPETLTSLCVTYAKTRVAEAVTSLGKAKEALASLTASIEELEIMTQQGKFLRPMRDIAVTYRKANDEFSDS